MMKHSIRFSLGVLAAALLSTSALAEDSLVYASFGGAYQAAQRVALLDPLSKELGITVKEDTTGGLADIRAQVGANAVKWDIVELGAPSCAAGAKEGLFEPLDYSVIKTDGIDPSLVKPDWVGFMYFSTVMAWSKDKFGENGPKTWAEFWDTTKFPGTRALGKSPVETMEVALMADGVEPSKLYPLDADRAFASLEKIKPSVVAWWASGAQAAQLLKDGEADLVAIWNGRASAVIKDGANAAYTFDQGLLGAECLLVPKGAPNKELAMKVIAKMISPELQANIPAQIDYGPITSKAFETGKISEADAARIASAPANAAKQAILGFDYWTDARVPMTERMDAFIQQ